MPSLLHGKISIASNHTDISYHLEYARYYAKEVTDFSIYWPEAFTGMGDEVALCQLVDII